MADSDGIVELHVRFPWFGSTERLPELVNRMGRIITTSLHGKGEVTFASFNPKKPHKAPEALNRVPEGDSPSAPQNGAQNGTQDPIRGPRAPKAHKIESNVLDQAIQKGGLPYNNDIVPALRPFPVAWAVRALVEERTDEVINAETGRMYGQASNGDRVVLSQAEIAEVLSRYRHHLRTGGAP
jgi:hypothetical protein